MRDPEPQTTIPVREMSEPGTEEHPKPLIPRTGNPATDRAIALLLGFIRSGVRHVVLSPGSRSQALALIAAELERCGMIDLHVRIDERVSGFIALGLGRETGLPAIVITTSGTATANLHPAVLEAHEAGVPLILVTADRPEELRGIRSNQTTHQSDLYGKATRLSVDVPVIVGDETDDLTALARDAVDASVGAKTADPGPVQLNISFREPLSVAPPDLSGAVTQDAITAPQTAPAEVLGRLRYRLDGFPELGSHPFPTIVIAGADSGPEAENFARENGFPLIAEVSSGSRFGPNLVVAYRQLLRDENFGGRVRRAFVYGHPTLSREVPELLQRDDVEVIVVAPTGAQTYNPGRKALVVGELRSAPRSEADGDARDWVRRWVRASRDWISRAEGEQTISAPDYEQARSRDPQSLLEFTRHELEAVRAPITRTMLVGALWRYTWPHDALVLAASRLIRDADQSVPGKKITVHSNRGLAGIDGTISTAVGIALGRQAAARAARKPLGVTRVLLGDLAFLHDAGALLVNDIEAPPRLQIIVGNDGGGTIFDGLEVASVAPAAAYDRVMYTPHHADIASLARAYGVTHTLARTRGDLDRALSTPDHGVSLVEVPLQRAR